MPTNLSSLLVDWDWPNLQPSEQAVVRRYEALIQADRDHTFDSAKEMLKTASLELKGRALRMRIEDSAGISIMVAREGRCSYTDDVWTGAGVFQEGLDASVFQVAEKDRKEVLLFWPGDMLNAIQREAHRLDRSISWMVQRAWMSSRGAKDEESSNTLPRTGQRLSQAVYLPMDMYAEISAVAKQEDCSVSTVVQTSLQQAWPALLKEEPAL